MQTLPRAFASPRQGCVSKDPFVWQMRACAQRSRFFGAEWTALSCGPAIRLWQGLVLLNRWQYHTSAFGGHRGLIFGGVLGFQGLHY